MLKITIQTGDDPLETRDFYNIFTAYPLAQNGYCTSTDERLEQIWDVSWRITRLCALETYMDCSYYEQVQYIEDTRIQSLISMYVEGDDRLARNAINSSIILCSQCV